MAETALLIIFILLLILGSLLASQYEKIEELKLTVTGLVEENVELEDILRRAESTSKDAVSASRKARELEARLLSEEQLRKETERSLSLAEERNVRLAERDRELTALESAAEDAGFADKALPEVFRELTLVRDAISRAGIKPEAEAIEEAFDERKDTLNEKASLDREVSRLKGQLANLRRQAEGAGKGLEMPPCWATPDGKQEYIFDVALTSTGLIVRDRELPHRAEDRKELPLSELTFGEELTPQSFRRKSKPIYDWSVEHECRFFVRAFDLTKAGEKAIYKKHKRILGDRFYSFEPLNEKF